MDITYLSEEEKRQLNNVQASKKARKSDLKDAFGEIIKPFVNIKNAFSDYRKERKEEKSVKRTLKGVSKNRKYVKKLRTDNVKNSKVIFDKERELRRKAINDRNEIYNKIYDIMCNDEKSLSPKMSSLDEKIKASQEAINEIDIKRETIARNHLEASENLKTTVNDSQTVDQYFDAVDYLKQGNQLGKDRDSYYKNISKYAKDYRKQKAIEIRSLRKKRDKLTKTIKERETRLNKIMGKLKDVRKEFKKAFNKK